ncbi:MAG: sigma-70 family RNA polymerase sigma factor [Anaerolineae bacterium]|nr:sigma-70 family RNA polymerase sigma factor [Anaerolineae bacterium]
MDDQQAIRRLKAGDIGGLAVLVKRYQSPAIETAYLITHDLALAEDVVQDVFLQVYQYIGRFDLSRPVRPWLMRSVVNAAVKAARRESRDLALNKPVTGEDGPDDISLSEILPDFAPGPDDLFEQAELETVIEEALRRLVPEQRAAIVLRYYLELTDAEISTYLDCAPGTVRWRLHAARKQLGVWLHHLAPDRSSSG